MGIGGFGGQCRAGGLQRRLVLVQAPGEQFHRRHGDAGQRLAGQPGLAEGAGDLTAVGCPALRVISLSFILAAVGITLGTVFQAVGKGVYSLINSLCRQLMVLLPAAWLLSRLGDLSAVWWSFPIAEVVSLAVCLLLYRRVDRTMLKTL